MNESWILRIQNLKRKASIQPIFGKKLTIIIQGTKNNFKKVNKGGGGMLDNR